MSELQVRPADPAQLTATATFDVGDQDLDRTGASFPGEPLGHGPVLVAQFDKADIEALGAM